MLSPKHSTAEERSQCQIEALYRSKPRVSMQNVLREWLLRHESDKLTSLRHSSFVSCRGHAWGSCMANSSVPASCSSTEAMISRVAWLALTPNSTSPASVSVPRLPFPAASARSQPRIKLLSCFTVYACSSESNLINLNNRKVDIADIVSKNKGIEMIGNHDGIPAV